MIEAVGIWFYAASTQRHLYLLRNDKKYKGHWGLPGGKIEQNETLIETIERECIEEMGVMPVYTKLIPIEQFTTKHFIYHTFYCVIENEFTPILNHEHDGYAWINSDMIPRPLHPGFWATLKIEDVLQRINTLKDIITS